MRIAARSMLSTAAGLVALAGVVGLAMGQPRPGHAQGSPLAAQARAILSKNCGSCHGAKDPFSKGFDVARRETLVTVTRMVVPEAPDRSELLRRIESGDMPPSGPKVPPADQKILREWIAAGAADWTAAAPGAPAPRVRASVAEKDLLVAIVRDLETADPLDRPYLRYFSIANLHNNPSVPEERLALYRTALSKLVNHLSWAREIRVPRAFGPSGTLFRIDLRDYDWKPESWSTALAQYPYGYSRRGLENYPRQVRVLSHAELPYVRVDWFVANASIPPLYHEFLQLPATTRELEERLGVDVERNLTQLRAVRGGRRESGVSRHNRVVERHTSRYGAYYKSYDFAGNREHQNIFLNPIRLQEDGGEFIFHLPNGLMGYYIAKANGERLDEAPPTIVFDSGNKLDPVVRNGLSCIGCHVKGVKSFGDQVRDTLELFVRRKANFDVDHALRLYPKQAELDRLFKQDEELFTAALQKTGASEPGTRLDEPIFLLALDYFGIQQTNSVPAVQAAADMNLPLAEFQRRLQTSTALQLLGFNSLVGPTGAIKRDTWESAFPQAVEELGVGEGVKPRAAARVGHRVGGDHDDRVRVAVGQLTAPTPAQAAEFRQTVVAWLQRSARVRIVNDNGEYTLRGTLRAQAGALLVQLGDSARGVVEDARGAPGDMDGVAEQIANSVHFRITGEWLPAAAAPAGSAALPAGVARPAADLLAGAVQGDGPVKLRLSLDRGPGSSYRSGEVVEILFSADQDCHVALYNRDSAGKITLLFPSDPRSPSNRVQGGTVQSFRAQVDPNGSFGVESVVAVASLEPIDVPGLREFRANPTAKSLVPIDKAPHEVAAELRQVAQKVRASTATVRFFTAR